MEKFLVAFDKCKGSLSASELCELTENYLKKRYLGCQVKKAPLTDGGEGFVEILTEAVNGTLHSVSVKISVNFRVRTLELLKWQTYPLWL